MAPPVVVMLGALHRDVLLTMKDSHDWRTLIFLAVLISHAVIVLLLIRTARQAIFSPRSVEEPLVVVLLQDKVPATVEPVILHAPVSDAPSVIREPVSNDAIAVPPEAPPQPKIVLRNRTHRTKWWPVRAHA